MSPDEVHAVAERVDARLATSVWDLAPADQIEPDVSAAAEVAVFALKLAGKRRQARLGGRFSRVVVRFALAACVAMASVATACDPPSASPEATAQAISQLPDSATSPTITAQPRASPARFTDLLLLDAGSAAQPWALMAPKGGDTPVLVDRVGAGLDTVGGIYGIAAQPVTVGTRDGPSEFLDPLQPAVSTGTDTQAANSARDQLVQRWGQDERYLAATRAIAGQPTVLDAAYNAAAASAAGGTHTYLSGIVLRVEPDNPVLEVIDRALLESGRPTRAEDVVYVAIRASETSLYEPGQVVNLRDVVMDKQTTDVNGQPTTVYVANAALDGARVEPTERVDLAALLQPRLQVVNQDLALQDQVAGPAATPAPVSTAPQPTATRGTTPVQQPIIVQQSNNNGSAYIGDFLIFMWLTNGGFYRGGGGTTIINNYPVYNSGRPGGSVYYSPPPAPTGAGPSTIASSQAASRSTALEASRSAVSGQSSGTGGGVAATNKSAADATSRVSAATSKSASVAGAVSASSAGKSISSAPSGSSSTASRSAGSVSAGSRGSAGSSSSSSGGSKGIGGSSGSSGSSGGFGGKGISGGGGSSSS